MAYARKSKGSKLRRSPAKLLCITAVRNEVNSARGAVLHYTEVGVKPSVLRPNLMRWTDYVDTYY